MAAWKSRSKSSMMLDRRTPERVDGLVGVTDYAHSSLASVSVSGAPPDQFAYKGRNCAERCPGTLSTRMCRNRRAVILGDLVKFCRTATVSPIRSSKSSELAARESGRWYSP